MSTKIGRPKVNNPKEQRFSIRLDVEQGKNLDAYCIETGKKRAEAIREGIDLLLDTYNKTKNK